MSHTLEEIIAKRRADRGDPSPIGGYSGGGAPPEDNSLEGIIARRRAAREAEEPVAGPPAPDPAQTAKDTAWLDKQRADQMGIPLGLYQNLIKPVGEALPTIYSPKEYAEGVPRGYHGLDSPTGESGLLAPERVGHLAGTGQDVLAGTGAATAATVLNPFAAPITAPLSYGAASGLSQYERTRGYRPNAGAESLVGGALNAAGGPILKGLGMGAKFVAPEFTAAVSNRLSGAGGQMLLGSGLGGAQELIRGGSAADIGEQMIGGGAAAYGSKRLGDYLGPKILENFPGSFGDKLRMQATAHEAARAGVSPEAMAQASPGGQAASPNAPTTLDSMVQAAVPWSRTGRAARAAYRGLKGGWNQGADERALYEKVWDTMTPGEEWTPTPKSGEPLERGPATGPNQPNQPLPVDQGGALFPGPLGPPQPLMEPPTRPPGPQGPIQGTQVAPKFGGPIPRFPRFGGGAGGGVPEAPPMGPQRGLPQPSEEEIADLLGQTRGPLAGTSRFGTVNPAEGVRPSETLESTFPGGIRKFTKSPLATPAIKAEQAAITGAIKRAAREGLEGNGPPEGPTSVPPTPRPKPPTPPARPAAASPKAPPPVLEGSSVPKPAPPSTPKTVTPPKAEPTFYLDRSGHVVRVSEGKAEVLGKGGKVLRTEEIKDKARDLGRLLGTTSRIKDMGRIQELLGKAPERLGAPAKAVESAPKAVESASEPAKEAPKATPKEPDSGRTLTQGHMDREAALNQPYPEEPGKTYLDKFHEVMRGFMGGGKKILARFAHQGHGQPAKRGVYEDREYFVRDAPPSLSGKPPRGHDPKSGRWIVDKVESATASGEGSGNEFRRSLSPISADRIIDPATGQVLYRGPNVEGSTRAEEATKASEKLSATEPPKPEAAADEEAKLKKMLKMATDLGDWDLAEKVHAQWEVYRKEKGLGTGGGKINPKE